MRVLLTLGKYSVCHNPHPRVAHPVFVHTLLTASAAAALACDEKTAGPEACAYRGPPASKAAWGPDPNVFADNMVLASSDVWHAGSTPARSE